MESTSSQDRYVFIETFGCQMNDNDSIRMMALLEANSYRKTDRPEEADLILVNTCSVRDKAEQKVYSTVGRYKSLKEAKPGLVIGISGCVAQQAGASLLKRMPHVDMVVGTHNIHRIPALVNEVLAGQGRVTSTEFDEAIHTEKYSVNSTALKGKVKCFVNIMRGCDNFCTYCIVPYVRGREVSRPAGDILGEVRALAENGVREVTLLGQNVNSYDGEVTFPELLRRVSAIDGIDRVRFVTSHPKDLSEELIHLFGEVPELARSMHLPVQSGSDRVLERMRRGYTVSDYVAKVRMLRDLYPDMAITTDVIVGFPGESDDDFEDTLSLVREVEYDGMFSFKYSPRPETEAAGYPDQVPDETRQERLERLQSIQKDITLKKNTAMVGRTVKVLAEGPSKADASELTGRTSCNRVVNFPGDAALKGSMVDVLITEAYANSLRGICRA